ncbi:hypothetical protein B0A50_05856 [Salinomyces thailandicus]|uniref:Guanine nucleotide-binding protein-like 3 N-terminal domain-containing protein n=1 Tax=Salinomyces thailandicus TaxID=706561 RepID=A0A4V5N6G2_9PEZI|nr:hypothetical protein B0A50_05856 [Salinomyces thailandica]
MKVGKPTSKRTPVRLRHKIQKSSANKQRKQRKEAKTNPQWRSRIKKDPGVPNLFPYKGKILAEIEEKRRAKEEEQLKKREIAKAQRQGKPVVAQAPVQSAAEIVMDGEEGLIDPEAEDEMEVQDESNPMAALLASAQARASAYTQDDEEDEDDESEDDEDWDGIDEAALSAPGNPQRKVLPKQALADPIKAVTVLIDRMQKTTDGIQRMLDHYNIPPLVTAGSDTTSRYLVEVARKRGRLGRGGVPNLHSSALTVLTDLNEGRMVLPAAPGPAKKAGNAAGKSEVKIVSGMAKPFQIEGLFGDDGDADAMAVES